MLDPNVSNIRDAIESRVIDSSKPKGVKSLKYDFGHFRSSSDVTKEIDS